MKYFSEIQHIQLTRDIIEKCGQFANRVISTVDYSDSRQFNKSKVWQDKFIGKIGEEAVYQVFKRFTDNITKPDREIYVGRAKSWDADIKVDDVDLAIKTQSKSSSDRYGLSWMFQAGQRRRDSILDKPDAWVCFVLCDDTQKLYECTVHPAMQIKDLSFGEPKLKKLRGEKKVVYAEDNQGYFIL